MGNGWPIGPLVKLTECSRASAVDNRRPDSLTDYTKVELDAILLMASTVVSMSESVTSR